MISRTARETSGPIPSPGIDVILCFMGLLGKRVF
jgi:hypothetical protein